MTSRPLHVAYLSLQAVVDGQDTWAAVMEVVEGWRADGWIVDTYFPHYPGDVVPGPFGRLAEMLRVQRRLAARIGEYDAIYVRAHQMAWPTARRASRQGIPVVQECNGPYEDLYIAWPSTRIARAFFDRIQRQQYESASGIVAVSDGLRDWVVAQSGNSNVVTSGNGANVNAFSPDAPPVAGLPERYAVFFGQFPPWQGITTLLQAVRLPGWPAELALVFVGHGLMARAVRAAADELPERVIYLGRLPYNEVSHVVAHAEISYVPMVAPERENMFSPLKLYESMACGVPVIATDVVGISEVVNESECGILFPAGDAEALVAATVRIASDPALGRGMGQRGREAVVERYSWRARARQRAALVEKAIERKRSAAGDGAAAEPASGATPDPPRSR